MNERKCHVSIAGFIGKQLLLFLFPAAAARKKVRNLGQIKASIYYVLLVVVLQHCFFFDNISTKDDIKFRMSGFFCNGMKRVDGAMLLMRVAKKWHFPIDHPFCHESM